MCALHRHSCDSDKISYYCSIASATAWKLYKDEIATLVYIGVGYYTEQLFIYTNLALLCLIVSTVKGHSPCERSKWVLMMLGQSEELSDFDRGKDCKAEVRMERTKGRVRLVKGLQPLCTK